MSGHTAIEPKTEIRIEMKADMMRSDLVQGLAWFVNYAAIDPAAVKAEKLDLHGSAMLPEDLTTFAHRWLAFSRSIDIQHDGVGRPIFVVESFMNSKDISSPSWPLNSHAVRFNLSRCTEAMEGFAAGRLNCVSLDAFTFDVKKKLPAAALKSAQVERPTDPIGIAREIAQLGFPGVTGVSDLGGGLMLVQRGAMPPIAVEVSGDEYEITPAGGAWTTLAARLITNGTLAVASTTKESPIEGAVPSHGDLVFSTDFTPWNPDEVLKLFAPMGVDLTGRDPASPFAFLRADGAGEIPHHTIRGVSKQAVIDGFSKIRNLPSAFQAEARLHLMKHLQAMP